MKSNREYRAMALMSPKDDSEYRAVGYASTFEQPYTLYEDDYYKIVEVVDRNAFNGTDMNDVIFQFDHEGRVFSRSSNGTLIVRPDDIGLYTEAYLGGTAAGRELHEDIRGGYITKMSFGFTVEEEDWKDEEILGKTVSTRRIMRVGKLYDVSAVSIPANDSTSISCRNLVDGVIEKIQAERLEAQRVAESRARLLLRLRTMGV